MGDKLLTRQALAERLDVCLTTFDAIRRRDPAFPEPVRLPGRMLRWRPDDVEAWLEGKVAAPSKVAPLRRPGSRKSALDHVN